MAHTIEGFLSRIQGDRHNSHRDPAGARKETLDTVRHRARHLFTALADQVTKIRDDNALSDVGKQQRLAELAKKQDLGFFASPRTANEENIAQLRGLLFAIPKSEHEPMMGFAREREIRDWYKDKPANVILAAYQHAVQGGDHERVRALTQGPLGSLVEAEFQQRVQIEHAEKAQPAMFANFEEAQNLKEHLDSLEIHARQVLQELVAANAPVADPRRPVAA